MNDDNDECILYAHSEIITHRETFELIKIQESVAESSSSGFRTRVAIKSTANSKIVSIESEWILKANKLAVGPKETFIVYFGPDNKITLRSKGNLNFVSIEFAKYDYSPMLSVHNYYYNNFVFDVIDLDEVKDLRLEKKNFKLYLF